MKRRVWAIGTWLNLYGTGKTRPAHEIDARGVAIHQEKDHGIAKGKGKK